MMVVVLSSSLVCGCLSQNGGASRAQEASNEFNLHTRFGRIEQASERVAVEAREMFIKHRAGWGGQVRIADLENGGMRMLKENTEAEVTVRIAWYRPDEGDLHVTTLKQHWKDFRGDWRLVGEERTDGDLGLIGEVVHRAEVSDAARPQRRFPTVRLSGESQD